MPWVTGSEKATCSARETRAAPACRTRKKQGVRHGGEGERQAEQNQKKQGMVYPKTQVLEKRGQLEQGNFAANNRKMGGGRKS